VAYYYFLAQLPSLAYGQQPPMTSGQFRALCAENLDKEDLNLLPRCTLSFSGEKEPALKSGGFIDDWTRWNRTLTLHLARYRAQALKREVSLPEAPAVPVSAEGAAKNAVTQESPLEAELILDKARWDELSELEGIEPFSVNKIFAYLLKLELMERRRAFNAEKGFGEYQRLYNTILEGARREAPKSGENK
jgi:hypothetical protein